MAVSQKLVDRLKSFEMQNKHAKAIAELNAQADKAEVAGFKGDFIAIRKKVFEELVKLLSGEVEWVEPHFFRGEVTIEEYTDYSSERLPSGDFPKIQKPNMTFGWRGGNFNFIGEMLRSFHPIWSIDYEWSGTSAWRKKQTNKIRIYVGDYGSKLMFRQLKDGGFRYADIARTITNQVSTRKELIKTERARNQNKSAVQTVIDGLDEEFKPYNGIRLEASATTDKPVFVKLDKSMAMTPEAAIEMLNMLRKHGIG